MSIIVRLQVQGGIGMYHCHLHFYLLGRQGRIFEVVKGISPFEHFTHEYMESEELDEAFAAKADVILADLGVLDVKEAMQTLVSVKRRDAELILLADKNRMDVFSGDLQGIKDIWICPMSDEEIRFRFLRWQQECKMSKDYWQTSHFFEATINNVPNLIWYKDKNGIHEKVNDSFL